MKPRSTDPQPLSQPETQSENWAAEGLLGGYATGTLSEAEKQTLFQAALKDQALFDALADEEALRELLSDPAHRTHLIDVLNESLKQPTQATPTLWHRKHRPLWMGLAASLVLAMGTHLLLTRNPELQEAYLPSIQTPLRQSQPKSIVEVPKTKDSRAQALAQPKREVPFEQPSLKGATNKNQSPAPAPSPRELEESEMQTENEGFAASEAKSAPSTLPAPPTSRPPLTPTAARLQKSRPLTAESLAILQDAQTTKKELDAMTVAPHVQLGPVQNGHILVTITWNAKGHLYVLTRHQGRLRLLEPHSTQPHGHATQSLYDWQAQAGDNLEVYVLDGPLAKGTPLDRLKALSNWQTQLQSPI